MGQNLRDAIKSIAKLEEICEEEIAPVESSLRMVWTSLEECFRYDETLSNTVVAADVYRLMLRSIRGLEEARSQLQDTCGEIYDLIRSQEESA